jgi:DNA polymerase-3 subunit alpha
MSFVHLHCHSEYSLLDGLARIPQMVARAKELGQPALALTDHGVMYGAIEFWQAATDAGIKPIIGMESYLARGKMSDRLPGEEAKPYHLLLLAKDMTGYKNLLQLASLAQLQGFYYKPRVDKETLAAHSAGLICTTGCLAAEIPRLLTDDRQPEKARREIGWYYDVFGPENFFFELQDHGLTELHELNKSLAALQPHFNARFLATNDTHYVTPDEAKPHDVLLCIQTSKLVTDPNRMRMSDGSYYLKSRAEMEAMFGQFPGALDNTLLVAEMCDLNLKTKGYHLPHFPVPEGHTPQTYLRQLCEAGLVERYGSRASEPEVRQRLEYELEVIHKMGFDAYFLIVWDLCRFARSRDIWWNVRGSGASSIVAYSSGITNLDPLRNSLIFERFLNPGRISMPDIDLDYPDDRRAEMIEYTVQKYGHENVAQIITFGTLGARAAIRDIGRAMDIPLGEVDRVAKLVPSGPKVKLKDAFDSPEFKDLYDSQDYIRQLIDTAGQLEGVNRHASTHAAGVVISDQPLVNYVPLHRPTKGADDSALGIVTQFPMEIIEKIGLLKVDFLGLATLTIMRRACELIERRHGRKLELASIPYLRRHDDPAADADVRPLFELLSSGHVDGIFQVESEGMRNVLTSMKPTEFEHIIAVVALYRPGPMDYIPSFVKRMHGEEPVAYHHPDLAPILGETFGIIVYQEQIIQIATKLAGYSPGEADQIRKAVGKKKQEEIARHRQQFIAGCLKNGYTAAVAEAVYGDIEFFANYGFNKAHAADYAMITCQTAYLKAHYPVEYMTALLSVARDDTAKVALYAADARRMGLTVLPPDVNYSGLDFTIEERGQEAAGQLSNGHSAAASDAAHPTPNDQLPMANYSIRFGLAAVKNVGAGAVQVILEARERGGPFQSLSDFCQRVDLRAVGKRALECLIKVGAFEAFGHSRGQMLDGLDQIVNASASHFRAAESGQLSMFGGATDFGGVQLPKAKSEIQRREMLTWEKELIGLYVSDHPLQPVLGDLQAVVTHYSLQLGEDSNGQSVTMAGVVTSLRTHFTKKGDPMGFVSVEDLQGHLELVLFPRTWREVSPWLAVEQIVVIYGKVDAKGTGQPKILVDSLTRDFKVTRSAEDNRPPAPPEPDRAPYEPRRASPEPARAQPQPAGAPRAVSTAAASPHPAARRVAEFQPSWDDDGPPPWLDDELPLPDEDWQADDGPELAGAAPAQASVRPGNGNGQGEPGHAAHGTGRTNGSGAPAGQTAATKTAATQGAASQLPARKAATGNGHAGNGANGGAGSRAALRPPSPTTAAASGGPAQLVVITIESTGDKERDKRRLRRLHGLLTSYPGQDQFEFSVHDYDERSYQLRFPNDTTGYCPDLERQLYELFGPEAVSVRTL